ncbi:MAG: hypothetical protein HKP46_10645 [Myxococcales bacterium]|nr:hypothetical protein [Myxococcales bacterium]
MVATQPCSAYNVPEHALKYKVNEARVDVEWHDEWVSKYGENLPEELPPQQNWQHPLLSGRYAGTMHEDSQASDVSDFRGPIPNNARVTYFHVLEKGKRLTGMAPVYTFLDDQTLLSISFGRDSATLMVVDITDEPKILDQVDIPGRGSKMKDLMKKEARMAVFRDTSGGAYSYLNAKGYMYVPGADNTIMRIPIRDRKIQRDEMKYLNLAHQVATGTITEAILEKKPKDNKLTAILPDPSGKIWFTSKFGIIGVIDEEVRTEEGCPTIYATAVQTFASEAKLRRLFDPLPEGGEEFIQKMNQQLGPGQDLDDFAELRDEFRRIFLEGREGLAEQIQNSFSVGQDGVYVVSNLALYKLRFNDERKEIELDPTWASAYATGNLIYDNDFQIKPGHLNDGSGTTPTLVGNRHVVIVDNAPGQLHLMAYSQKDGSLVSKVPIFEPGAGAVENSVVAYEDHLIVGNTYGYVDPFAENPTPGGIHRIDFDQESGEYVKLEGWPATGHLDAKTATPKLSTPNGLIYVYNRDVEREGHHDWQLTALDFRTGLRVFRIKGYFEKGEFGDNVNVFVKRGSLGKKDYDRKVFNNLWGTFTFGPDNAIYLGAYRGFVRIMSDQ